MKILLAVDGSAYTKKMLGYLAAHDEWLGGGRHQYTVLHTVSPVPARAASVNSSWLPRRRTSWKPRSASSALTCWLTAAGVT